MTEENILEKNLKVGSRKWLDKPRSLPLNLRGRRWGLWFTAAFFFLLPLQTRYIFREASLYEWGTLSIFVVEALGWVVIVLGFTRTLKHDNTVTRSVKVLLCLSVTVVFLSIAWAPDKAVALATAVRVLEGVLLYAIISATVNPKSEIPKRDVVPSGLYVRNPKQIQNTNDQNLKRLGFRISNLFVWSFLAGALLQAGLGIYQFLAQSSFVSTIFGMALHDPVAAGTAVVEFADQRWLRAYGGLPHPNVLGGYLVVALAIVVKSFFGAEKDITELPAAAGNSVMRVLPIARWTPIPILVTGIFFTFSRAAWIAGIGLLSYWVIGLLLKFRHSEGAARRLKNPTALPTGSLRQAPGRIFAACLRRQALRMTKIYVLLTAFYVLFLVLMFRPLVAARIFPDVENRLEVRSRVERVAGVGESWQLIKKHPVFGVGIGNYTQAVQREVRPGDPLWSYQPVHNVPLLIWAELGTIGLLLLIGILYFLWHQSQNYLLLTTFYILLIFDHYLWSLPFGILLFWGILGLSTGYVKHTT